MRFTALVPLPVQVPFDAAAEAVAQERLERMCAEAGRRLLSCELDRVMTEGVFKSPGESIELVARRLHVGCYSGETVKI